MPPRPVHTAYFDELSCTTKSCTGTVDHDSMVACLGSNAPHDGLKALTDVVFPGFPYPAIGVLSTGALRDIHRHQRPLTVFRG